MTASQYFGIALVALPFVGFFFLCAKEDGYAQAAVLFGTAIFITAIIVVGVLLALGGAS